MEVRDYKMWGVNNYIELEFMKYSSYENNNW